MNILNVDDNEENRYLLESLLKGSGHEVQSVVNGLEAFEKIKAGGVELIISDILMPVMDGFQLCRKVKTDEAFCHIPFIFYTATYTGPQDEEFAMKIGADSFILKPCDPAEFMQIVGKVIADVGHRDGHASPPQEKEEEVLKLYNERLVRKLEQKMLQAEREIQARQAAEEDLRISNTRLRLALASANIGLWDWNIDTDEIWFSPEYKRQIGYDDHELPDRFEEWENRLHPEDRPRILAEIQACLQGRVQDYQVEYRLRHKNGNYLWIAAFGKIIRGPEEKSKRFMGCHVDIDERKRGEAEKERLMAAIEEADEIVFITDTHGVIQYANPAFETVTGYTREEAVGRTPRMLKSGEQDRAFYRNLWETITSGKTWKGRMVNKRRDGKHYVEDGTISPVFDKAGRVVNYVAIKHDITEHLQLEEQLLQARKMESVGRLAGGVAHDFNNMLNVIMGYAELALSNVSPEDPLRSNLKEILDAGKRSSEITRQLLAFARQQTIAPKVIDLNKTVESMLKLLRKLIGEDIDLVWLPGRELWWVKLDPVQVDQILVNLCVNARDAIGGVGKVTIETKNVTFDETHCADRNGFVPGDYVSLVVSDDGPGIDPQYLEKVFDPFFTTKPVGRGTGLGLATVYGIVKQNDGLIGIQSEKGQGTTISLYLLRHTGSEVEKTSETSAETPSSHSETVLLVEDDPSMLELGNAMLENLGYTVLTARTPGEALDLAAGTSEVIHLLITDVVLPEMNGRDFADRLRHLRPEIKVLFMSGYTAEVIAHEGVLEEGIFFLQKPFLKADLSRKVREALGS